MTKEPLRMSNPGKDRRIIQELRSDVDILKNQVKLLMEAKMGPAQEVIKTKELADLKITELKKLCDESGIDYADFGNTKAPYVKALEARKE